MKQKNTILISEFERIYDVLDGGAVALRGQSVLITGASGLIGSYLIDFFMWLNKTHNMHIKIWATTRTETQHDGVNFIQCDLSIPGSFNSKYKFDRIIHTAGPTDPAIYANDPVGVMKTNIIGTMQILDTAIKTGAQVLFISSGEVYGNNTDHPFTENDKCVINTQTTRSCYPAAKVACESMCQSYAQMYDLHANIVRPGFVYGPNISDTSARVNAQFLRRAVAGENILLNSHGNQMRSWVYVADAVSAILYVMLNAPRGELYNIAAPNEYASIYQYACAMARIAGVDIEIASNASIAINANSILDATKLINMGWRAQWDLETGIKNTVHIKSLACVDTE